MCIRDRSLLCRIRFSITIIFYYFLIDVVHDSVRFALHSRFLHILISRFVFLFGFIVAVCLHYRNCTIISRREMCIRDSCSPHFPLMLTYYIIDFLYGTFCDVTYASPLKLIIFEKRIFGFDEIIISILTLY